MPRRECPECSEPVSKCLLFGFPMWMCFDCGIGGGLASGLFSYSNGELYVYEGSYWKALWEWLTTRD